MSNHRNNTSASGNVVVLLIFLNAFIVKMAFIENEKWYLTLIVTLPLLLATLTYHRQKRSLAQPIQQLEENVDENTKDREQDFHNQGDKQYQLYN